MGLRYPCLVVDHDDTSVMSTPSIHYPAHVEALRRLRPGMECVSLEGFLAKNFDPGFMPFLEGEIGLSEAEIAASYEIWREFTSTRVPEFFPGLLEIYAEHKRRGGALVVVSHSESRMIERDYRAAGAREGGPLEDAMPDLIFGWEADPERRKPAPYPLLETMRLLGFESAQLLVLDDLKPGADMAAEVGADFAAALWGHRVASIREAMLGLADYCLESVGELRDLLFA